MEIYLVGGAVRDKLLGLPVEERDWVVVGSSREEMLSKGFKPVGKDFPVYLHPETGEEYALARTERKTAPGHKGFEVDASRSVTLEDDLGRRDLTVNAIAEDHSGNLVDPYGGCQDIEQKILRHVSEAFIEDPLRVLRAARFACRFHHLGFRIDTDTQKLLAEMVEEGLLTELPPERIWGEVNKTLSGQNPYVFFEVLLDINALSALFPGTGTEQIEILKLTAPQHPSRVNRLALFLGTAPSADVRQICRGLKIPNNHADMAQQIADKLKKWKDVSQMEAEALVEFIYQLDGFRRKERLNEFNLLCRSIVEIQNAEVAARNHDRLNAAHQLILGIDSGWLNRLREKEKKEALQGKALGQAIKKAQAEEVASRLLMQGKSNED